MQSTLLIIWARVTSPLAFLWVTADLLVCIAPGSRVPGFSGMARLRLVKIEGAKLQNNHGFIWRFTTAMWDVSLLLVLTSLNLIPKYFFPALSAANDDKPECNSSLFGDLPPPSKASETAKGQKRKLKEDSKERKKSAPGENGLLNVSF